MKWTDMEPIPRTYEILAWKVFNRSVDEKWADWAVEMMQAGFETESLSMLALLEKPYNQFELKELTDRILVELGLSYEDNETVIRNYATYLVDLGLKGEKELRVLLSSLRDIYYASDYNSEYLDFYLLSYAKEDLEFDEFQYYWNDADRTNIDEEILKVFRKWKDESAIDDQKD
ncbi:MAG: hypothetical protein ABJL20_12970 [Ekhidna sp.]